MSKGKLIEVPLIKMVEVDKIVRISDDLIAFRLDVDDKENGVEINKIENDNYKDSKPLIWLSEEEVKKVFRMF